MSKVTNAHALAINRIMLPLISQLIHADYVCEDADMGYYSMIADDVAHNTAALCVFNNSFDAAQLHDNIMRQDTSPREHFYNVLVYIEDNALISANKFACK